MSKIYVIGSGNAGADDAAKLVQSMEVQVVEMTADLGKLQQSLVEETDAAKAKRIQVSIEAVQADIAATQTKLKNSPIRPATDDERREALHAILNMDERRRAAPNYLKAGKVWVQTGNITAKKVQPKKK
jgi:DNA-binding protein H-NS